MKKKKNTIAGKPAGSSRWMPPGIRRESLVGVVATVESMTSTLDSFTKTIL
jgi:hypothetical protein